MPRQSPAADLGQLAVDVCHSLRTRISCLQRVRFACELELLRAREKFLEGEAQLQPSDH
jgi:hypothetical protein